MRNIYSLPGRIHQTPVYVIGATHIFAQSTKKLDNIALPVILALTKRKLKHTGSKDYGTVEMAIQPEYYCVAY